MTMLEVSHFNSNTFTFSPMFLTMGAVQDSNFLQMIPGCSGHWYPRGFGNWVQFLFLFVFRKR
jgi:hypothetical protein